MLRFPPRDSRHLGLLLAPAGLRGVARVHGARRFGGACARRALRWLIDDLANMQSGASMSGKDYVREIDVAKELLARCRAAIDCYLETLADWRTNTYAMQFAGIKAAYQIGVLGDAEARDRLLDAYPKIENSSIRFTALIVADALSPNGEHAIATRLRAILDDAIATRDPAKMQFSGILKQFIPRFDARAE